MATTDYDCTLFLSSLVNLITPLGRVHLFFGKFTWIKNGLRVSSPTKNSETGTIPVLHYFVVRVVSLNACKRCFGWILYGMSIMERTPYCDLFNTGTLYGPHSGVPWVNLLRRCHDPVHGR